jgi:hypothetical protein
MFVRRGLSVQGSKNSSPAVLMGAIQQARTRGPSRGAHGIAHSVLQRTRPKMAHSCGEPSMGRYGSSRRHYGPNVVLAIVDRPARIVDAARLLHARQFRSVNISSVTSLCRHRGRSPALTRFKSALRGPLNRPAGEGEARVGLDQSEQATTFASRRYKQRRAPLKSAFPSALTVRTRRASSGCAFREVPACLRVRPWRFHQARSRLQHIACRRPQRSWAER